MRFGTVEHQQRNDQALPKRDENYTFYCDEFEYWFVRNEEISGARPKMDQTNQSCAVAEVVDYLKPKEPAHHSVPVEN